MNHHDPSIFAMPRSSRHQANLFASFEAQVATDGDRPAVVHRDGALTYSALHTAVMQRRLSSRRNNAVFLRPAAPCMNARDHSRRFIHAYCFASSKTLRCNFK